MGSNGSVERVLVLEPYGVASHRAWADGYATHSRFEVRSIVLPGERWRWRLRLGAVELARQVEGLVSDGWRPDVLLVSSMVDVAALLGLGRKELGDVPVVVYFHESQFSFPDPDVRGTFRSAGAEFASTHVASMAAADVVAVNSKFHADQIAAGVAELYGHAPVECPVEMDEVAVVPVGVEASSLVPAQSAANGPPLILWNHRWDHDKNPQAFFAALRSVADVEWRLAVVGENTRSDPQEFEAARVEFADRIVQWGHVDREGYETLLAAAAIVCSTAVHEYFGVAMVEAMIAGAVPLVPNRLSYPEVVPERFHDAVLYDGRLGGRLRTVLLDLDGARRSVRGLREALVERFDWPVVAAQLDSLLHDAGVGERSQ